MPSDLRVLVLEDRADDAELLIEELRRSGYRPEWTRVETREAFVEALDDGPDIIISDYSLPTMTAPDALRLLQDVAPEIPVIVVSGVMDEETCVNSLRLGAVDYLLKDRLTRLGAAVEHALAGRRMTEEAQRARRQRREAVGMLRGVVEHAPAAIYVRDMDGKLLMSNTEYANLVAALPPGVLPGGDDTEVPAAATECEVTFDVGGEQRTYLSVHYPVVNAEGRAYAAGGLLVDVTRQKQVEQRLRELDRMKTDFIASVSHELRTPLTSICGYAEILNDDLAGSPPPETQKSMLQVIGRNSQRLLSLVEDLLTLSRIDSGALVLAEQPVDLGEIVWSTMDVLRPSLTTSGVRLDLDIAEDLPAVTGDRGQLERVMLNLVSNAVKFSERGGRVVVGIRAVEDQAVVTVEDNGIGIPAEDVPRLFTRFYRSAEARKRAIQGTGLGLAVAAGIVERHGGSIAADSEPGRGTTMTVRLPLRCAPAGGAGGAEGADGALHLVG